MGSNLFYQYNPWWEDDYDIHHILPRKNLEEKMNELMLGKSVIFLTGLRRIGKTTLM